MNYTRILNYSCKTIQILPRNQVLLKFFDVCCFLMFAVLQRLLLYHISFHLSSVFFKKNIFFEKKFDLHKISPINSCF